MAKREGFQVPNTVVTPDDTDTWAVAESNDIKGGLHTVETKDKLESIPEARQDDGMVVYVRNENKYYEKRGGKFVERKEVVENKKPWTTENAIHSDSYGATMIVPYVFMSNPGYQNSEGEYSATNISADDVIVDSKMNAYTRQQLTSEVIEVDNNGFKLISKVTYDNLMKATMAPGVTPFEAINANELPAIAKPYALKEGDTIHDNTIVRKNVDGSENIVDAIVNVRVKNLKKMSELTKDKDGNYSAGEDFPLVFVSFNKDDANVAFGKDIKGTGVNTVAVGTESATLGISSTAVGYKASAMANSATAFGESSLSSAVETVAIGASSNAKKNSATAIGAKAMASGSKTTTVGADANASGDHATSLGADSMASGGDAIAVGNATGDASGDRAIAIGSGANAAAKSGVALGYTTAVSAENAVAIGNGADAAGKNSVALGPQAKTYEAEADVVSVGSQAIGGVPEMTRRISHVSDAQNDTDAVTKKQLDAVKAAIPEIPADAKFTDTTYSIVTSGKDEGIEGKPGLMSVEDKLKLDSLQNIDTSIFMTKPNEDSYVLKSDADNTYAKLSDNYLKCSDIDKEFVDYAKKTDMDNAIKKSLFSDDNGTQPIYAKTTDVKGDAEITAMITEQLDAALKIQDSTDSTKYIDRFVTKDIVANMIKEAIDEFESKYRATLNPNWDKTGEMAGDNIEAKKDQEKKEAESGSTDSSKDDTSTDNDASSTSSSNEENKTKNTDNNSGNSNPQA